MSKLDELRCEEHEAPYLICNLKRRTKRDSFNHEIVVVCPVDQKLETLTIELQPKELDDLYLPLADKIFRCEKCYREIEILDVAITKKLVSIYVSCSEHGHLITREIDPSLYDKIKFAWDTKDMKEEVEQTY